SLLTLNSCVATGGAAKAFGVLCVPRQHPDERETAMRKRTRIVFMLCLKPLGGSRVESYRVSSQITYRWEHGPNHPSIRKANSAHTIARWQLNAWCTTAFRTASHTSDPKQENRGQWT